MVATVVVFPVPGPPTMTDSSPRAPVSAARRCSGEAANAPAKAEASTDGSGPTTGAAARRTSSSATWSS